MLRLRCSSFRRDEYPSYVYVTAVRLLIHKVRPLEGERFTSGGRHPTSGPDDMLGC
jgi:hypothetical protein